MCSCRTHVPMIACILVPRLRAPGRAARPASARAPAGGARAAARDGAAPRPGRRRGGGCRRAARRCGWGRRSPSARRSCSSSAIRPGRSGPGKGSSSRLEDDGFAVEPVEPGCLYFDTRGVERLYGGVAPALKRALRAVGASWDACAGAADRRFAALAAAAIARPGQALVVSDDRTREFLAPLPLTLLPLEQERREELEQLGSRRSDSLPGYRARRRRTIGAGRPARLEPGERNAGWGEGDSNRVHARRPPAEIAERLEFPEAVGNELTLRRALQACSTGSSPAPSAAGGRSARSRSPRGSSVEARGVAPRRCASRAAERGVSASGARAEARRAPRARPRPRHRAARAGRARKAASSRSSRPMPMGPPTRELRRPPP